MGECDYSPRQAARPDILFDVDFYMVGSNAPIMLRDKFDADLSLMRVAADSFNLLTFSGEYWRAGTFGHGVFSNEAIWTIDYIMGFTLLTGALYLHELHRRILGGSGDSAAPHEIGIGWWRLGFFARACIAVSIVSWLAIEFIGVGEQIYIWSKTLASFEIRQYLGMSKRFLWQWSCLPSLFLLLVFSRVLLDGPVADRWAARIFG